jgi:hypothetical protein
VSDQPRTGVEAIAIGLDDFVDDLKRGDAALEEPATPHALMVVALGAFLDSIGRLRKDEVAILFTEADEFTELEAADHPQVAAVYRCLATIYGYPACNARSTRLRPRRGPQSRRWARCSAPSTGSRPLATPRRASSRFASRQAA